MCQTGIRVSELNDSSIGLSPALPLTVCPWASQPLDPVSAGRGLITAQRERDDTGEMYSA